MIRVCFACLGNICRSPTVEGVFRRLVDEAGLTDQIHVESAGTAGHHEGEPADPRSRAHAAKRGYVLDRRARRFRAADFARFDLVLALDDDNERALTRLATTDDDRAKIRLLLAFDPASSPGASVPDPYYGGDQGFELVLDLSERAATGLLAHLRRDPRL